MREVPPVMPLFDTHTRADENHPYVDQYLTHLSLTSVSDASVTFEYARDWLLENLSVPNNYKSYRSEITLFLHWCFCVEQISVTQVKRSHMSKYLLWTSQPDSRLISRHNKAQFIDCKLTLERSPNPAWRPFTGKAGPNGTLIYEQSESAPRSRLAVLSIFYTYLINEEVTERNPAAMLLKKRSLSTKLQSDSSSEDSEELKALTLHQWQLVLESARILADQEPEKHERTLFMIQLMYSCYLRISEVSARPGHNPIMGQFRQDKQSFVWGFYIPRSKGGKRRTVAVSRDLLQALIRYRTFLGLSDLPSRNDTHPLFVNHQIIGGAKCMVNANLGIRQVYQIITDLFSYTANSLREFGNKADADDIERMTPHSLRHTGISHDINVHQRPLSHVQADAGHDSIDTTSKYLHTSRLERHESAIYKPMKG